MEQLETISSARISLFYGFCVLRLEEFNKSEIEQHHVGKEGRKRNVFEQHHFVVIN